MIKMPALSLLTVFHTPRDRHAFRGQSQSVYPTGGTFINHRWNGFDGKRRSVGLPIAIPRFPKRTAFEHMLTGVFRWTRRNPAHPIDDVALIDIPIPEEKVFLCATFLGWVVSCFPEQQNYDSFREDLRLPFFHSAAMIIGGSRMLHLPQQCIVQAEFTAGGCMSC